MHNYIIAASAASESKKRKGFKEYSLVGFHDADGHTEIRISKRKNNKLGFSIWAQFDQLTKNSDVLEMVTHTIGEGRVGAKTSQGRIRQDAELSNSMSYVYYYYSTSGGLKWIDILKRNPPLMPEKRRDSSIASRVDGYMKNPSSFSELDYKNGSLVHNKTFFTQSQLKTLNRKSKHIIYQISMVFLAYHNAASMQKSVSKRQIELAQMNDLIDHLQPSIRDKKYGMTLGAYFLSFIDEEEAELNSMLNDSSFILPDDYFVGVTIGDGSFEIETEFKEDTIEIRPVYNFVTSKNSKALLQALQNKFGVGSIKPVNSQNTAFCYRYHGQKLVKQTLIPLFNQYELSKSKEIQFILWSKITSLLAQGLHKTPNGYKRITALKYQLNKYHKTSHTIPKQIALDRGKEFFLRRGIPF